MHNLITIAFCLLQVVSPVAGGFDWLITPEKSHSYVQVDADGTLLMIGNGMVSRTFKLDPSLSTISMSNLMTGEEMVRAASPEALITIDGTEYSVGGLAGQTERGYLLPEWIDSLPAAESPFVLEGWEEGVIKERIHWARSRWALNKENPTGKTVTFTLRGKDVMEGVTVKVQYAAYDRIPVISKQFEVINGSSRMFTVDKFRLEHLAMVEPDSPSGGNPETFLLPNIHVESDYNCAGSFSHKETDITTHWVTDPDYTSQRNYSCRTKCILDVNPPIGPSQQVAPGAAFSSFTVYEMPYDSYDRERQGLFQRRFYRTVAPWSTENPIFLHLTSTDPEVVHTAVDQAADTGYEMIILSFGSGLNAEDVSPENIARFKALVDYAHSKGIQMGCYSLLASRRVDDESDCINPKTGKPGGMTFGNSPCLGSEWGERYFANIEKFLIETGMDCFEHDGSYPGDKCASTSHPGHRGLDDSQWTQFYKIAGFYHRMCERGVYLNVPDFYLLNGTTKTSIGYKEVNWSLPRANQILHTRQLNNDCTYDRPQSALWSFVPLTQYHGGGAAATIEPLDEHLDVYKALMFQNYSSGVQACYRGPRLYDTERTRQAVIDIISWYKEHRDILNSDIIHLRKADGRDWDGMLHVNPSLDEKGLAIFYNPLDTDITRVIRVPLYYTGLEKTASISEQGGKARKYKLSRDYTVDLEVTIPANGHTWFLIK